MDELVLEVVSVCGTAKALLRGWEPMPAPERPAVTLTQWSGHRTKKGPSKGQGGHSGCWAAAPVDRLTQGFLLGPSPKTPSQDPSPHGQFYTHKPREGRAELV